jgi:hypothetical protein
MTSWHEDNVEVLPPGSGAKPWLPAEPVTVPVVVAGDYNNKVGEARVYASEDGALMADVTFREGVNPDGFGHQFGADGQVVEYIMRDGVQTVTRVELLCLAISAVPSQAKG